MGRQGARQLSGVAAGVLLLGAMVSVPSTATGAAPLKIAPAAAAASSGGREITVMLPGNVPLVLVRIPAGTFTMGSPIGERSRGDDETQHLVTLTRDYFIGKYEVTQGQWLAIMGNNPSYFSSGDEFPVDQVSWADITGSDGFLARQLQAPPGQRQRLLGAIFSPVGKRSIHQDYDPNDYPQGGLIQP